MTANASERVLRETFMQPFKDCLHQAGAISVMASYNEIADVPSHPNRWLLRDVLRKEWSFKGFVVSDYSALWAIFADVADYLEWTVGRRFTGMVFAAIGYALKSGLALGSVSILWSWPASLAKPPSYQSPPLPRSATVCAVAISWV